MFFDFGFLTPIFGKGGINRESKTTVPVIDDQSINIAQNVLQFAVQRIGSFGELIQITDLEFKSGSTVQGNSSMVVLGAVILDPPVETIAEIVAVSGSVVNVVNTTHKIPATSWIIAGGFNWIIGIQRDISSHVRVDDFQAMQNRGITNWVFGLDQPTIRNSITYQGNTIPPYVKVYFDVLS